MKTEKRAYQKYACIAGEPDLDGARCQHPAIEYGRCQEHQERVLFPPAIRPTRVLVKLNLPQHLVSQGLTEIVEGWKYRSWSVTPQGRQTMRTQEDGTGRNRYIYRSRVGDMGSEVFCGDGAINISVPMDLIAELFSQVGGIASIRLWKKSGKRGAYVLQLEFRSDVPQSEMPDDFAEHHEVVLELLQITWGKTYVYCNLPREDGTVLHTVNLTGPQPAGTKPRGNLVFAGGDWGVKLLKTRRCKQNERRGCSHCVAAP